MSKRRGVTSRSPLEPDDILAGRVKPTAGELLELIHRINPTGRDLGPREAAVRYAQKSRLQSVLVRRFAEELEVVPDPEREGTVSLRHREHRRDACHAVIAGLDEDARAWVQRQVDLGAHLPDTPAAPAAHPKDQGRRAAQAEAEDEDSEGATPEVLLRRAEKALEQYDYEGAHQALVQAVSASGGAREPAAALVAFLVETLGDDAAALALEGSLPAATIAAPRVCGPLALAAARSGDEPRALALAKGAAEHDAAAVFAALAAFALAGGDPERAAGHLEQARKRDPACPAITAVAVDVARAQAAARRPAEAELEQMAAAGRDDEADQKAAELLARWPQSEVARRVQREIEERRRSTEAERLAAEAEAALATGNITVALARFGQAAFAARGRDRERIELRMRAIEEAERERRETQRVNHVQGLLAAPDPGEGLLAYLELDDTLRDRVRPHGALELLRVLDLTARGAPRARVEAVLALGSARERAAADPEAALASLEPHLVALEPVAETRQLVREIEAHLMERRAARAMQQVHSARAALEAGVPVDALRRLADVTLRDLPEQARAEVAALQARAARAAKVAEVERLRAAGALFDARALAEELGADSEGEERARWARERRAIQDAIQRAFCVEVDSEPLPWSMGLGHAGRFSLAEAHRWLTADGFAFVIAEGHERWVFVRLIDRLNLRVCTSVVLRAPEPIGDPWVELIGRTLWLVGARGAVIALEIDTWDVQRFRSAADVLASNRSMAAIALPAGDGAFGPRFLWITSHEDEIAGGARVIDLECRRPPREIPDVRRVAVIAGAREPRVACFTVITGIHPPPVGSFLNEELIVHDDRGHEDHTAALRTGRSTAVDIKLMSVAAHPDGRGLVALVHTELRCGDGKVQLIRDPEVHLRMQVREARQLCWVEVPFDGPARPPQPILNADGSVPATIASARDTGLVAVVFRNIKGGWELCALHGPLGALELLYRVPASGNTMLLQDAGARHLVAFESRPGEVALSEIGPAPPVLRKWSPLAGHCAGDFVRNALDLDGCFAPADEGRWSRREQQRMPVRDEPLIAIAQWVRLSKRDEGHDPAKMMEIALALQEVGPAGRAEAKRLRAWLWETYPDHAGVRLLRADELGREGRWQEVRAMLAGYARPDFGDEEPYARHLYHLLALASLHLGDPDHARAMFKQALPCQGACALVGGLQDLLAPLPDSLKPKVWGPDRPPLVQLAGAVRAADGCLSQGDPRGALDALDRELFWISGEVQLLARLAEASLRADPESRRPESRWARLLPFRKRDAAPALDGADPESRRARLLQVMALAKFLEAHAEDRPALRKELPIPGATWERERLDELAARARAWLDAQAVSEK